MRAIFAYLASGDWSDVLDEHDLPLKDKVGIALRFLSDDEVREKGNWQHIWLKMKPDASQIG